MEPVNDVVMIVMLAFSVLFTGSVIVGFLWLSAMDVKNK